MLYTEIIGVCSQIDTKHVNTLCGPNVEFVSVKPGGAYSNHWALGGLGRNNLNMQMKVLIKVWVFSAEPSRKLAFQNDLPMCSAAEELAPSSNAMSIERRAAVVGRHMICGTGKANV